MMFGLKRKREETKSSFLDRLVEAHKQRLTESGCAYLTLSEWVREEIKKDIKKDFLLWLKVSQDIKTIEVSKTSDTGDTVLIFTDTKGNRCSLWLHNEIIRSILPY